jgi:hypothetical protein
VAVMPCAALTASLSRSRAARSSPSQVPAARARARCCTCSAGWRTPTPGRCASRAPCGGRCGRGPSTVPAPHLRVHRPGIEPPAPGYRGRECRGGPPARRRGAGRAGPPGRRRPGPGGPGRRRREAHRPALRRPAAARRYRPRAHRRPRRRARRRAHGEPRLRQRPGRDPAACGTARERGSAVVLVTHDSEVARHADRVVHLHSGVLDAPAAGTPERAQ